MTNTLALFSISLTLGSTQTADLYPLCRIVLFEIMSYVDASVAFDISGNFGTELEANN